jgi:hypothetical protein
MNYQTAYNLLLCCPCGNTKLGVDDVSVKWIVGTHETLTPYITELAKVSTSLLGKKLDQSSAQLWDKEKDSKIDLGKVVSSLGFASHTVNKLSLAKKRESKVRTC